MLFPSKNYNKT